VAEKWISLSSQLQLSHHTTPPLIFLTFNRGATGMFLWFSNGVNSVPGFKWEEYSSTRNKACTHKHAHAYTSSHSRYTHAHKHTYTHAHTHTHSHTHTHIHIYIAVIVTLFVNLQASFDLHTRSLFDLPILQARTHTHTHTHTHTLTNTHTHIHRWSTCSKYNHPQRESS